MVDHLTPSDRSRNMAAVRGRNTKPEMIVRRLAHRLGYRFRLHRKDIPGTPDLTFIRLHKVIFVHGCFWHRHPGCPRATTPQSNIEFWEKKLSRNVERDRAFQDTLVSLGWDVIIIWECQTRDLESLKELLRAHLDPAI